MNVFGSNDKGMTEKLSNTSESLKDTGYLVPPQEEKNVRDQNRNSDGSWLAPPQEEKIDVAGARGERCECCPRRTSLALYSNRVTLARIDEGLFTA